MCISRPLMSVRGRLLLGIYFWRESFKAAFGPERRGRKGVASSLASKCDTCIKSGGPPELLRGVDFSLDGKGES
jgi:hypothetical protein